MKRLGAIVLAAGVSSRVGKFKPLLPIGGSTLIRRTVDSLHDAGAEEIVIVTGYRSADIEYHLQGLNLTFVKNTDYAKTKMFDSVRIGLLAIREKCDKIMIVPADNPLIQQETFKDVLAVDAPSVRPVFGENNSPGHPVVLRSDIFDKIIAYGGERGLRGAVETLDVGLVDLHVPDRCIDMDADSMDDYYRLIAEYHARTGSREPIKPDVEVGLASKNKFLSKKTALLLEIADEFELKDAADCLRMSIDEAHSIISSLNEQMGYEVFSNGLTKKGRKLLEAYRRFERELESTSYKLFWDIFKECL